MYFQNVCILLTTGWHLDTISPLRVAPGCAFSALNVPYTVAFKYQLFLLKIKRVSTLKHKQMNSLIAWWMVHSIPTFSISQYHNGLSNASLYILWALLAIIFIVRARLAVSPCGHSSDIYIKKNPLERIFPFSGWPPSVWWLSSKIVSLISFLFFFLQSNYFHFLPSIESKTVSFNSGVLKNPGICS